MNDIKRDISLLSSRVAKIEAILDEDRLPITTAIWDLCEEKKALQQEIHFLEKDSYYEVYNDDNDEWMDAFYNSSYFDCDEGEEQWS